jgi:hypothetical protein
VLFHLIGATSQFRKPGITAIGNSRSNAKELNDRTLKVLETETANGHPAREQPAEVRDRRTRGTETRAAR